MKIPGNKVVIVGAGNVGCTFAFSLMISGLAREIVIVDRNRQKAEGEAMDLNHGMSFTPPALIYAAGYEACQDADVVVITAGARQKPGQTRIDLVKENAEMIKLIIPEIVKHTREAVILLVSNPVDILTYITLKLSGLPVNQVFGSGTTLDTSRLRYLISEHCGVDTHNVHAYIIGEHGDTELPVWSHANIAGMVIADYCPVCPKGCDYKQELGKIFDEVKNAGYKIIEAKGSTYYAIGLALVKIVKAILRNENAVMPVSTLINGYYGINDVCLSLPAIINKKGVQQVLSIGLSGEEDNQLKHSAETLKQVTKAIGF
jgi:L-lactate dehydrogenase